MCCSFKEEISNFSGSSTPTALPWADMSPELIRNGIIIFSELVPILAGSLRKARRSEGRSGKKEFFSSKRTLKNRILKHSKQEKIKVARLAGFGCGKKVAIKQKLPGVLGGEASCRAGQVCASSSPCAGAEGTRNPAGAGSRRFAPRWLLGCGARMLGAPSLPLPAAPRPRGWETLLSCLVGLFSPEILLQQHRFCPNPC